ncbi:MAG: hypothetical protein JWN29_2266 [Acidimicrobiales bacterium]|nr:hypothetical protein [Acidimicrobiales bacterium]
MVVTATYTSTPKEILRSYRVSHPVAYGFRIIAAAVLVVTGLLRGDLSGVVLGAALLAVGEFSVRRQLRPYLQGPVTVTVTATEDDYRVASPVGDTTRPWSAFRSARRTRGFWVLQFNRLASVALPVRALDDAQAAAFEALLRRHRLL